MDEMLKDRRDSKRLLIVSYHFPPDAAVGSIRPAKFAKYLREYNWEPVILTAKERYYETLDPARLKEIKHTVIARTIKIPMINDIYLSVKNIYLKKRKSGSLYIERQKWALKESGSNPEQEGTVLRLHRYFNSLFVWLPDDKAGWVLPAFLRGLYLIKKHKIDSIFTTSPPNSVHLVGLLLKLMTKKPWIADFRDPWFDEQKPFLVRSKLGDIVEGWLRKMVIKNSDRIVSVTPEMTKMVRQHYQEISTEKFHTISNGYDKGELERHSNIEKYDKFTITYAGTFYLDRNPELLLQSLSDLIEEGRIDREKIQVRFIGNCRYTEGKSVENMIESLGLEGVVAIVDHVPHDEALSEMAKSHALLLLNPEHYWALTGKLFEYIGLKAAILSVCGEGAITNFLREYPKTVIVPPGDLKEMKKAILTLVAKNKNGDKQSADNFPYETFESKNLTKRLAILLDRSKDKLTYQRPQEKRYLTLLGIAVLRNTKVSAIMVTMKNVFLGRSRGATLSDNDMISILRKRLRENIQGYFPEILAKATRIVGRPWRGTGTGRTFKFRILSSCNKVSHDIFIKVSPKFENLNPGTSEYEALKLLYPKMPLSMKGCHVPRPLDFFYDLNALVTESVGKNSFKRYLLRNNSKKRSAKSLNGLSSVVEGCAHWLHTFHEITKNGIFVQFEPSKFTNTFVEEFEILKKLGLFGPLIDKIESTLRTLSLLDGKFLMPCAMWHYDFTPGHVFIDDNKICVIDVLGLPDAPIYEDIGKWLSAMPVVNSFPLYPNFDYECANGWLGDVFLDAYLSQTTLAENEFVILSNIFKLKHLILTFVAQTSRISEIVHPIASKMFIRLRLRRIYERNLLRTIDSILEKTKSFL